MSALEWIGKGKVINHHQDVPLRALWNRYYYPGSADASKENVKSGNLEALKALLPQYEGGIRCIDTGPLYDLDICTLKKPQKKNILDSFWLVKIDFIKKDFQEIDYF